MTEGCVLIDHFWWSCGTLQVQTANDNVQDSGHRCQFYAVNHGRHLRAKSLHVTALHGRHLDEGEDLKCVTMYVEIKNLHKYYLIYNLLAQLC